MRKTLIFYETLLVLFLVSAFFFSRGAITGYVAFPVESIDLNEVIRANSTYTLAPLNPGNQIAINSLRVTGEVVGTGNVEVYVDTGKEQYLVYSNKDIEYRQGITGLSHSNPSIIGAVVGLQGDTGVEIIIEDENQIIEKKDVTTIATKNKAKATDLQEQHTLEEEQKKQNDSQKNVVEGGSESGSGPSGSDTTNSAGNANSVTGAINPNTQGSSGGTSTTSATTGTASSDSIAGSTGTTKNQNSGSVILKASDANPSAQQLVFKKESEIPTNNDPQENTRQENIPNPYAPFPLAADQPAVIKVNNKCLETCQLQDDVVVDSLKFRFNIDSGTIFKLEKITYTSR